MQRLNTKERLSKPITQMKSHYQVVVIGSGYGGSIAASRLSRCGQSVCLLERGKEHQTGEYPDTLLKGIEEVQINSRYGRKGSPTGLYDLHVNDDIHVFVGCGLGGTSLINANVSLEADPRVFEEPEWPKEIRKEATSNSLKPYYDLVKAMLKPVTYPDNYPLTKKTAAHKISSQEIMDDSFKLTCINVNFDEFLDERNHVGVVQQPCSNCGDCISGCNYGAKNTLLMNYLPDAYNHGADIFACTAIQWIEQQTITGKWLVYFQILEAGRERFSSPPVFITADIVILAAGTLGSTEILLRSRDKGLILSNQLGKRFTGNGDVLGFAYNCDKPINGVGYGSKDSKPLNPVGPSITSVIDVRNKRNLSDSIIIEEGSIPGMLTPLLPQAFSAASLAVGKDTDTGFRDRLREIWRSILSFFRGARHGAMQNTQTYLVMAHDSGNGAMRLSNNRLRVDWKKVGSEKIFSFINQKLMDATKALGGTFIKNPIWTKLLGKQIVTVHPLGGCSMGSHAGNGVVNHEGQVFNVKDNTSLYDGLYVADGSIIPRPLGVNPLLTISALAERICMRLADSRDWVMNSKPNRPDKPPGSIPEIGFRFTESMIGYVSKNFNQNAAVDDLEHYKQAENAGRNENTQFQFILTMEGDLDRFIEDPNHQADTIGIVHASFLSPNPLSVHAGFFNLFVTNLDRVETKKMLYSMKMTSREGKVYFFEGFKQIHDDPGFDVWSDTTTLYVTIYDGDHSGSPILARGVLYIEVSDFVRQLRTIKIMNTENIGQRTDGLTKFATHFTGSLFQTFGKSLREPILFDPDAQPRQRRLLRTERPKIYFVQTKDGELIRLARYKGGDKGPVMLSHGLGVSSLIFTIDTIKTNLLEFLYEHGYDVWLLDYRVSIELNSAELPYNADDIAKLDYPAAIDKIREITNQESIQVVAHCYGATTFTMSMLAGLRGVRSAVISQICTDIRTGPLTRIKAGMYLPDVLKLLGIKSMTAYVDKNRGWFDSLYDQAMKFYPIESEERANSPVHRRITFMYGTLYELDQLNDETFKALHEMFGIANIAALDHLTAMIRAGYLVNQVGKNEYLPHLDRLNIPMTFIHGEENACFLPKSTAITMDRLIAANGSNNYKRHVIPNYGHIDCIFGKNAVIDVYPHILDHLDQNC